MAYTIEYTHSTGDSYKTYEVTRTLEVEWESITEAKDALKRIKEHWLWYQFCKDNIRDLSCDTIDEKDEDFVPIPDWHFAKNLSYKEIAHKMSFNHLNLIVDNNQEFKFRAPWTGYFERLISAKVITVEDPDMSFVV